jgi:hypothetical protein
MIHFVLPTASVPVIALELELLPISTGCLDDHMLLPAHYASNRWQAQAPLLCADEWSIYREEPRIDVRNRGGVLPHSLSDKHAHRRANLWGGESKPVLRLHDRKHLRDEPENRRVNRGNRLRAAAKDRIRMQYQ